MTSRIGANNSLSISTKPGSTLPHLITTLLDPRTLPAWLAPLASLTPFESVKRTDFAFRVIEECESYRQSPASASTPYTGPAAAAVAHLLGALPATAAAAQTRAGMMRNRYTDIYPYDLWRVVLHHASPLVSRSRGGGGAFGGPASPSVPVLGTDGVPLLSEYINASILDTRYVGVRAGDAAFEERFDAGVGVEGCLRAGVGVRGRRYISTQGPMAETVGDFWCMLWDQRSSVVVMLTREEEKGRVKCFRYWPEEGPEYAQVWPHGVSGYEIRVECVEGRGIGEVGEIFVRRFEVSRAPVDAGEVDEVRIIHQVHFTGWPDHKNPSSVLKVIDVTNTLQREAGPEAGPMTVHCSAGCGRTGTFCVIDTLLYQLTTAIPHLRKRTGVHLIGMRQWRTRMLEGNEAVDVAKSGIRKCVAFFFIPILNNILWIYFFILFLFPCRALHFFPTGIVTSDF
ncbi:protein-tyrosine phosphatase-like protein [Chytriomyces sp. MP71]|nr:protein-tyrosine phosphatase-like protein [Chytriomyces sp. MP71]